MKKTIIISIYLSICFIAWETSNNAAFSQSNNLYFNQVINQGVTSASCYQVPANKVFKLEGVTSTTTGINIEFGSACGGAQYGAMNIVDDKPNIGVMTVAGDFATRPYPLWFKAGTFIGASAAGTIYISGIEFNIAP